MTGECGWRVRCCCCGQRLDGKSAARVAWEQREAMERFVMKARGATDAQ